jgi:hypothetical protein
MCTKHSIGNSTCKCRYRGLAASALALDVDWIAHASLVVIWESSQNKHIIEAVVLAQIWQAPRSGGQREPVLGECDPGGDLELEVRVRRGRRCVFRFVCEACDI